MTGGETLDQRNLLMHQVMLSDAVRLDAYDKALAQAVAPGDVVVDVGAGTLALTALALRNGAGHVYAIEADPQLVDVATRIIEASGWTDRVTLIAADARTVTLPRPADVLVAELIGNLGPEEGMIRILDRLARTALRPGGRIVPQRLVTRLAPAQLGDQGWGVWRDGFLDMRLDVVQSCVQPGAQLQFFSTQPTLLGEPGVLDDSRSGGRSGAPRLRLRVDEPGRLEAVLGWFEATLVPGVQLTNLPSYPGCNWAVWVWPLRHTTVARGDTVEVRVQTPHGGRVVTDWRLDCRLIRKAAT